LDFIYYFNLTGVLSLTFFLAGFGHFQQVYFGIRPSDLSLASSGIPAKVVVVEPTGAETELLLQIGEQSITLVMHGRTSVHPDDMVYLEFDPNKAHVFDLSSEQRL
jgi:multiple sugar transport system ATP-binding protein